MREKLKGISSEEGANWIEEAEQDLRQSRVRQKSWKVALRVLTLLKRKGISQTELAEKMNVSRQQVTKIVKGKENMTLETIDKLEQALGETLLDVPVMPKSEPMAFQAHGSFSATTVISKDSVHEAFFDIDPELNPFHKSYPLAAQPFSGLDFIALTRRSNLLPFDMRHYSSKHEEVLFGYPKDINVGGTLMYAVNQNKEQKTQENVWKTA